MQLYQIPFSHNCLKVRLALRAKGLAFETVDIAPMDRKPVLGASHQPFVPTLVDGEQVISDSTFILRWLEDTHPEVPLIPSDPKLALQCWMLEDWADDNWMALTRRLAYWSILQAPGRIEALFFPGVDESRLKALGERARRGLVDRFSLSPARFGRDLEEARELAAIASEKRGGRAHLIGDRLTVADIALAAMCAPISKVRELADDNEVRALLDWAMTILGEESARYR